MRIPGLPAVLALGLACHLLPAQNPDGPYWTEYPIPAGATSINAVGAMVVVQTPTAAHLYSGILRQWTVLPVTSPTYLGPANKFVVIRDGNLVHGWSVYTGQAATLTTSGSATVNIGSASSSWAAYVLDNNVVYGFSAFLGQWVAQPIQGSLQFLAVNSHDVVFADDHDVHAFSAFFGTWVSVPTRSGALYTAHRNGAVVRYAAPDEVKAFSVYQNTWNSIAYPNAQAAAVDARDGYVVVAPTGGSDALLYSNLTGNFTTFVAPPPLSTLASPNCLVFQSPAGTVGYACGTDSLVTLPNTPAGGVQLAQGSFGTYALLDTGTALHAFDGLSAHTAQAPQYQAYTYTLGDTAGFANAGAAGPSYAYSQLTGRFHAAPAIVTADVRPMFEGLVLVTPTAYTGFSARSGAFATLPSTGLIVTQAAGAMTVITDAAGGLDVFDPRLARWEHQNTAANPVFAVWRLTGVGHDGSTAYGYSLFGNQWDSMPMQGTMTLSRANSSIGFVQTTSHYYVFTGNGSLSNFSRFPEFSRFVVRGGNLDHLQAGTPGALVFGLFAFVGGEQATPFGTLRLDPASMVSTSLGLIPGGGLLRNTIAVPRLPALNGLCLHLQDVVFPPNGTPFLTNSQAPYLW